MTRWLCLVLALVLPVCQAGERTQRIDRFMEEVVARGDYLGAVTLVARGGKIVQLGAYGYRDIGRSDKMRTDSIFRIYSMTKAITAVAVLTLMEEGKLSLEDPVSKYLPAFADMRLLAGGKAKSPITIRQLLNHTAGFAVYGKGAAILDRAQLHTSPSLQEYAARLSRLPLAHDPGAEFHYDGVSVQLAARVVEVVSGMPFERYLQQTIFTPLKMADTGFTVPPAERHRIADMTITGADGKLALGPGPAPGEQLNPFPSGAGGLYSTAGDYGRFAQMLLGGGKLDGVSVLSRKSVELMMQNHLTQLSVPPAGLNPGESFGLGGSVVVDVARRGRLGSLGQFGWSGAASTYYTIDPSEKLVAILLMQHLPQGLPTDPPKLQVRFFNLVFQSLEQ